MHARTRQALQHFQGPGFTCWADKAYQDAGGRIRVPFRCHRLERRQRPHNNTHAKILCLGEQATATLKGRRLLRKLRYSTNRITAIVPAFLVPHHAPV
ncbi:transposase family protein [Streptomyces sp. NPDC056049]|uniref:transposase family protein n=1 Tax=Streptomyces sp. NPDC056049 TaxID=3345693 RepID=UPI0035DEEC8E